MSFCEVGLSSCRFFKMTDIEVEDIIAEEVDITAITKESRERKPNKYVEEWIKILLGSSNVMSTNDKVFSVPYTNFHDALVPDTNGYELFLYFYCNRFESVPICNPWRRNLAKLIFPDVFVNVDPMKVIIKVYNPLTKGFHRHDGSILCTLDRNSFIETSELEG